MATTIFPTGAGLQTPTRQGGAAREGGYFHQQAPAAAAPLPPRDPGGSSADRIYETITREQLADYLANYAPLEDQIFAELNNVGAYNREVRQAGTYAGQGFAAQAGAQQRQLGRYGVQLTPELQTALNRQQALARGGAITDARNNQRLAIDDRHMKIRQNMAGFGRNLLDATAGGAGQAAALATQRRTQNNAIDAQNDAATGQGLGTLAMLGMMMWSSSRRFKQAIRALATDAPDTLSPDTIQAALDAIEVKQFEYRPDQGPPGRFIGPIAEELPTLFRGGAEGQFVNLYNVVFALLLQNRALAARITALEQGEG